MESAACHSYMGPDAHFRCEFCECSTGPGLTCFRDVVVGLDRASVPWHWAYARGGEFLNDFLTRAAPHALGTRALKAGAAAAAARAAVSAAGAPIHEKMYRDAERRRMRRDDAAAWAATEKFPFAPDIGTSTNKC